MHNSSYYVNPSSILSQIKRLVRERLGNCSTLEARYLQICIVCCAVIGAMKLDFAGYKHRC